MADGVCLFAVMLTGARVLKPLLLALLLASVPVAAHAGSASAAAVKTAFLFNFFKFIDWPKSATQQSSYKLCTTDNDQLGESLLVLENKTVNGRAMLIRRQASNTELKTCHIVFIAEGENTAKTIRDLQGLPIVTVSDEPNFIDQGGMIGLIEGNNHLGFEINLSATKAVKLHLSAKILELAKRVYVKQ